MTPNRPSFTIFLTPPPEDQPSQHQRQSPTSSTTTPYSTSSPLLNARLEEARLAMQQRKEWEELLKHRKLHPTLPAYDTAFLSPLSAAKSRRRRRSRPRRSRNRSDVADTSASRSVPRENVVAPVTNNGGLQRIAESGRDSGVSGENVGQRPSDVAKAIESAEINQQDKMEPFSAKRIQRSSEPNQKACEGVFASEQPIGLSAGEGPSGFYPGSATNRLGMSQGMRDREHTEERVAIEGDKTVRKATRGRYVRKVWRPTLIRQVIICRIYFKRKVATDENPEDFIVTPPEPSIPQIESGSFLAAPKPRKIKAIYPEPSGEGGLEGGCDERNLGRRFAGIDAIMFSSMVVERSERGMTFESQLNNVARTVDKRYEAEDSSHPVNQLHPASPTPKGSIPSNPHSNLYTALPITGDVGRKIEDPVASTNILPGIGQETAEQLSSSLLPKAENQVSTGSKKIGFLKQYFRKSKQHFPPPAGQNLPSSVPGNRSQSAKCNGGPYPPGPTGRRLRSTLKDLLKTHCRGMAGCSWESTGLGGGFVFLN